MACRAHTCEREVRLAEAHRPPHPRGAAQLLRGMLKETGTSGRGMRECIVERCTPLIGGPFVLVMLKPLKCS